MFNTDVLVFKEKFSRKVTQLGKKNFIIQFKDEEYKQMTEMKYIKRELKFYIPREYLQKLKFLQDIYD